MRKYNLIFTLDPKRQENALLGWTFSVRCDLSSNGVPPKQCALIPLLMRYNKGIRGQQRAQIPATKGASFGKNSPDTLKLQWSFAQFVVFYFLAKA